MVNKNYIMTEIEHNHNTCTHTQTPKNIKLAIVMIIIGKLKKN